MKRIVWGLALAAAGLWTLFAWGAYALIGAFGGWAADNAGWIAADPQAAWWLEAAVAIAASLGMAGVFIGWLVVLALILVAAAIIVFVLRRLAGPGSDRTDLPPSATPDQQPRRDNGRSWS
jgi:hypothetical protein